MSGKPLRWGLWLLPQGPLELGWPLERVPGEDKGTQAFVTSHGPAEGHRWPWGQRGMTLGRTALQAARAIPGEGVSMSQQQKALRTAGGMGGWVLTGDLGSTTALRSAFSGAGVHLLLSIILPHLGTAPRILLGF